ncbi:MAG: aldehyde dehydrogenase family protein, partial [Planctomycetota bacterium]
MKQEWPFYLANQPELPNTDLKVTDKYSGDVSAHVAMANAADIDRGIAACVDAMEPLSQMAPFERQEVLNHCVRRFEQRFDELASSLCVEAGKPIKDSHGEVSRLIDTFRIAAEESVR